MLKRSIENYYRKIDRLQRFGGTKNETSIRRAFAMLLLDYCKNRNFELVEERIIDVATRHALSLRPVGTIIDELQLVWGYWESKDTKDDINKEIEHKISIGYPTDNIIFENSERIILIQKGKEILNCNCKIPTELDRALSSFINYERPEYKQFQDAITKFKTDVPTIVKALKELIDNQSKTNIDYQKSIKEFWELCKNSINPDITENEISEMLIQHILTEDIFVKIFGDSNFHRYNNIANQLEKVISTFLTRERKINLLSAIDSYYHVIRSRAANIQNHKEKQKFLKVVYENFYKAYNPEGADKLGVVYTPNEVVRFMVESTDFLTEKHFGKTLSDKNVEILDPATGTGTFITEIIDYIQPQYLEYKYKNEIHANEVSILPYYIANLNIEYTYKQKTGIYQPYLNICFVDTLENIKPLLQTLGAKVDDCKTTGNLFETISKENIERINKQNDRKISIIIGNPPYNANQQNENENNKNREYPFVDKRIKNTYIKNSTAQKTKQYDMYKRFIRWASDRIAQDGIIAFIVNRSFIDKRQDDGFRKIIENEFDNCFIIELGGDIRASKEAKGNIFDIKLGVAIVFLVKKEKNKIKKCRIEYFAVNDSDSKLEKLNFLKDNKLEYLNFNLILPDNNNNWINLTDNDWNTLIPLCNNETKQAKTKDKECAVFKQFTNGVATNRDEWVFDLNSKNLENKICFFIEKYNDLLKNKDNTWDISIKWSETLKRKFISRKKINFSKKSITQLYYRPFCKQYYYSEKNLSDRLTQNHFEVFGKDLDKKNATIIFRGTSPLRDFSCLASNIIFDLHVGDGNSGFQCISNCLIDNNGKQTLNITNWGVQQFSSHYKNEKISETNIFYYVYAVLHNPAYRTKYENNLKRELPRIPFYTDFWRWSKWGEKLIQLHTEYEAIKPDKELKIKNYELGIEKPKAKLKIDKTNNEIIIDEITTIQNIPASVWDYKLGNRSAVEWILDQYKEKNPEHETIKEKFNNYKFSDYKLHVIDLILRVSTVSIETMKIINEMKNKTE